MHHSEGPGLLFYLRIPTLSFRVGDTVATLRDAQRPRLRDLCRGLG
jgi:hypothetical protein